MRMSLILRFGFIATATALAPSLSTAAMVIVLPTGSIPNGVFVDNYYNNGLDSHNDGPGPNLGISFSGTVDALTGGGSGHNRDENAPSNEILYSTYSSSTLGVLNFASGFSAISLAYSLLQSSSNPNGSNYTNTVYLYSGLNGTGTQVGSLALSAPGSATACTVTGDEFCTWQTASATLTGTAESLVFATLGSVPAEGEEFDNIQLTPTPLPAGVWLLLSGLASLFSFRRRHTGNFADSSMALQ